MNEHTLPEAFCRLMTELFGRDEVQSLFASLDAEAPSSIRCSASKAQLLPPNILHEARPIPWCRSAYYLPERPRFTGQAAWHAGLYYVQEASSMLLAQIEGLLGNNPIRALDLCAAPGGKSTLLLDILPEGSVLLANEIVRQRAHILVENLMKWGKPNHLVTNTSPNKLGKMVGAFDLMLVDAPCSGEGMFRKDHNARNEWTERSPVDCAERQRSILSDIWSALKPGGLMIYSTCTMNRIENEDVLAYIIEELGSEPIALGDMDWGVWTSPFSPYPCYRMMPHRTEGEGLFMAVVRKRGEVGVESKVHKSKGKKSSQSSRLPVEVYGYLKEPEAYDFVQVGEVLRAYPKNLSPLVAEVELLGVPIMSAGIPLAIIKGKSLIPHTGLALSIELCRQAFVSVELNDEQLIAYLSRQSICLAPEVPQGIVLCLYGHIPLGFVKNLGNRCNNLYPQEWRIRHTPNL